VLSAPERKPGPRVRVAPSTSVFAYGAWNTHYGELVQSVYDAVTESGIVVEFDSDAQPRPGEVRAGAAPLEAIKITIEALGGFEGAWRIGEIVYDRVVPWIVRHRGNSQEEVSIEILGPNGEVLKSVLVSPDGSDRDWPPSV
jgi:hypothetical protein